jgi:hypothetical protein
MKELKDELPAEGEDNDGNECYDNCFSCGLASLGFGERRRHREINRHNAYRINDREERSKCQ